MRPSALFRMEICAERRLEPPSSFF
uniref:Uncharacterized protein n=1 Tax=Anguilla anguilla TaxID=7936 RepID=A0A0E9T6Z2_ANGAN